MKRSISVIVLSMMSASLFAAHAFSEAQKKEIQSMVHDYLVAQPEVLIEASQALQKQQQTRMQQAVQQVVASHAGEVFNAQLSTAGDAKGPVTLVEFFDYQCIHCKKMAETVKHLMEKDHTLRVVYKEFPIFGEGSDVASKAALAAAKQNQYLAMHEALIKEPRKLNESIVMAIANKLSLNLSKLKQDMKSKAIEDELKANRTLAEQLHLMGTPAFIIAATPQGVYKAGSNIFFIPGAASEESLSDMIKKADA